MTGFDVELVLAAVGLYNALGAFRLERILGMKWEEAQVARSLSQGVQEGPAEGGPEESLEGVIGAGEDHHAAAGRTLAGEGVSVRDGGAEINLAGGPMGAQHGERQDFVGLSDRKLALSETDLRSPQDSIARLALLLSKTSAMAIIFNAVPQQLMSQLKCCAISLDLVPQCHNAGFHKRVVLMIYC